MLKSLAAASLLLALAAVGASAQDRSQSRSMVMSQQGIVASESVLASQAGARILEQGGNAIDAAVATNAVMGLVAPMNDGAPVESRGGFLVPFQDPQQLFPQCVYDQG